MMPLLPLHIITSFYWDEFLVLLVPTTIVLVVGLEKLRLRGKAADSGTTTEPAADEVARRLAAATVRPQRATGRPPTPVRQRGKGRR
jgi:hypothetical protein